MDNSPLIGILLVSETNSNGSHLGLVNIPLTSRSQTITDFRNILTTTLANLTTLNFVFLTPNGWEINAVMESTIPLSNVISDDGVIKVRFSYAKPKYGISIEGPSDKSTPAGFLFCEPDVSISKLRNEIKEQLPSLYQFLLTVQFAFLDLNGWPIGNQQEKVITVLEVAALNIIRIQCARPEAQIKESQQSIEYSTLIEKRGNLTDISSSILQPITETMFCDDSALEKSLTQAPDMTSLHKMTTTGSFEILISYVHTEASNYALLLKTALEGHGYTVFLDVHCIQGGTDWQDALNDGISNCSLLIPLITLQYGQTLWTNREVKLADVLGKAIIPVNFLSSWPPKCLAIQFATTQFVPGLKNLDGAEIPAELDYNVVKEVAADISGRYSAEKISGQSFEMEQDEVAMELPSTTTLSRQDTILVSEDTMSDRSRSSSTSMYLPGSPLQLKRKSTIRSYASTLPTAIDASFRDSITKSRDGKPLIVVSCAPQQKEFAHSLVDDLKLKEYEMWCSCDIDSEEDEENARVIFQQKADEAGVVIFILSEEFATSSFCEQQVYYCEQRKRIIPVVYKPMQLPSWMAMLIGTSTFISCLSNSYKTTLLERIDTLFNPQKAEDELKKVLKQKIDIANMCSQLSEQLPKGKLVYVSGGTQFYSKNGKEICEALGKKLAEDEEIVLITGGFYGVGESVSKSFYDERVHLNKPHGVCHIVAIRDKEDKSNQTRQNSDLTFSQVPFGDTLFFGDSVRQREMLTPRVIDVCILVEGGPGAAFEAQQFVWNGNRVLPITATGGAAGGLFNVPSSIFEKPPNAQESDWSVLADSDAKPTEIASALLKIIQAVKGLSPTSARSRCSSTSDSKIRKRVSIKRSETLPVDSNEMSDAATDHLKRTMSEKRHFVKKQKAQHFN